MYTDNLPTLLQEIAGPGQCAQQMRRLSGPRRVVIRRRTALLLRGRRTVNRRGGKWRAGIGEILNGQILNGVKAEDVAGI